MLKLKKVKKLDPSVFLKNFKSMPGHIVKSVISRYQSKGMLLPSFSFIPKLNPKTLIYEDMIPNPPPPPTMKDADKECYPPFWPTVPLIAAELTF